MSEDKTKASEDKSSSIDEILRKRERLTQMLQDEFKKEVTVLFILKVVLLHQVLYQLL